MTNDKARKIAARQLAAATGQSYTAALRQLTTTPAVELGVVGQRVRVRQGVAYDYFVTVTDYSGMTGIVRHVIDDGRGRACAVESEDGKDRLVLPVFQVDDLEAAPVLWEDSYGEQHELLPVGTRIRYSGGGPRFEGSTYDDAPGWVIAHDLGDEVTPYHLRIDADGAEFLALPVELDAAAWPCVGDLVDTAIGDGVVQAIDATDEGDAVTVRLNTPREYGPRDAPKFESVRRVEPHNVVGLRPVDPAGNLVPSTYIRQARRRYGLTD